MKLPRPRDIGQKIKLVDGSTVKPAEYDYKTGDFWAEMKLHDAKFKVELLRTFQREAIRIDEHVDILSSL